MLLLGGRGFGHAFDQCPNWLHQKQGPGRHLNPVLGDLGQADLFP